MFEDADIIHRYTRADALHDGVLMDVSGQARAYGFRVSFAVTAAVWAGCIEWPEHAGDGLGQSTDGRLHDLLGMASLAARGTDGDRARFSLLRIARGQTRPTTIELVLHIGPGDRGEPVVTVMEPGED